MKILLSRILNIVVEAATKTEHSRDELFKLVNDLKTVIDDIENLRSSK